MNRLTRKDHSPIARVRVGARARVGARVEARTWIRARVRVSRGRLKLKVRVLGHPWIRFYDNSHIMTHYKPVILGTCDSVIYTLKANYKYRIPLTKLKGIHRTYIGILVPKPNF